MLYTKECFPIHNIVSSFFSFVTTNHGQPQTVNFLVLVGHSIFEGKNYIFHFFNSPLLLTHVENHTDAKKCFRRLALLFKCFNYT